MADAQTLLALADRCEREEPSRELDASITVAKLGDGWCISSAEGWVCVPHQEIIEAPHYTTSLNAAVTLVPNDFGMDLQRYWIKEGERWSANLSWGIDGDYIEIMDGKSGALVLCAAALRARAALAKDPT